MIATLHLLPPGYRALSEASDRLRSQIIISRVPDIGAWITSSLSEIHTLFLGGEIFAYVEMPAPTHRIRRISPLSWRMPFDLSETIASGLGPSNHRWSDIGGMPLIITDADFARILALSNKLPSPKRPALPRERNSPKKRIVELGASVWREDQSATKEGVRNVILAAGLKVSKNSWDKSIYKEARIAAGLPAEGKAGAPKKSRGL